MRQGVVDVRCCLDWLEQQGYSRLGIVGTSLGSCYAFIAAAHDPRIRVAAFNHASTYFADVVWHGQSTRHIRAGNRTADRSGTTCGRFGWPISPMSYFDQFARWPKKSLIIYAKYDLTFLPEFSQQVVDEFERHGLDHKVVGAALRPLHDRRNAVTNTWMAGSWLRSCGRRFESVRRSRLGRG